MEVIVRRQNRSLYGLAALVQDVHSKSFAFDQVVNGQGDLQNT